VTPVFQQFLTGDDAAKGDCLRASLATILDRPSDTIPNFRDDSLDWTPKMKSLPPVYRMVAWAELQGYQSFMVEFKGQGRVWFGGSGSKTPCVLLYDVPGKTHGHAVVARLVWYGVQVLHNPDPRVDQSEWQDRAKDAYMAIWFF